MGKTKQLFEETRILVDTDDETRNFFIRTWFNFSPKDQSPKELAESVQDNFAITCNEDQVIKAFGLDIEEDDVKFMTRNLNLYYNERFSLEDL